MKKSTTRVTIIILIGIMGIVSYYTYLSNRSKEEQQEATLSAVQLVLSKDLEKDYPPTPREVIKYYNEILDCFYNEEATKEEIEDLGNKARELYDDELVANNELGTYQMALRSEVEDFKKNNRKILRFAPASSINVEEFTEDGYSFARILCGYTITEDGVNFSSDQVYLLRKDANKRWKIYGWKPSSEVNPEQKEQ